MNINWKRCLCVIGIHWTGRSDGGGMGDAVSCDVCGMDRYGPAIIVNDVSKMRAYYGQSRLYYEAHLTIDPVFGESRERAETIAALNGFKLAKLLMQKGEESKVDTFMTAHARHWKDIHRRTKSCVEMLKHAGFTVRRAKIEDTLFDTKRGDVL